MATGATEIVEDAHVAHVKVIALDAPIPDRHLALYVGYNSVEVGQLQGQYIMNHVKKGGNLFFFNGSANDPRDSDQLTGYYSDVLHPPGRQSPYHVADYVLGVPPTTASGRQMMRDFLDTTKPSPRIQGIVAVNDEVAAGMISSLRKRHYSPWPVVVGQDASLAGVSNLLTGHEALTLYKPVWAEADTAADGASALAANRPVPSAFNQRYTLLFEQGKVRAALLAPVPLTPSNIESTVIKDRYISSSALCASHQKLCRKYHIK